MIPLIAAIAVVASSVQYSYWTKKVVAPLHKGVVVLSIIRSRATWAADVSSATSACGLGFVAMFDRDLRGQAVMCLVPSLILLGFLFLLYTEPLTLNRYPSVPPWKYQINLQLLRTVVDGLTPGVITLLVTTVVLLFS